MVVRVLFICTGNMDRSPTAERLLNDREGFEVTSAGTWIHAKRRITKNLIDWADAIFVMEEKHKEAVLGTSPEAASKIVVLDIPDLYKRDDLELKQILKVKLSEYLKVKW